MKKSIIPTFLGLAFLLIIPLSVHAFDIQTGDSIYVGKDDTVEGTLYAAGSDITVEGTVTGDVICAGRSININGTVEGDVICAGQSVNINGTVNGSVRAAGNVITINGQVARNVMSFGADINLSDDAQIGWDMLIGGATAEIRGKVGRDLYGGAASVVVSGEVAGDIKLKLDNRIKAKKQGIAFEKGNQKSALTITDSAKVDGELNYTSNTEAEIADGAMIAGDINHQLPQLHDVNKHVFAGWLWANIFSIFSSFVIGLVLISLWGEKIKKLTDLMLEKIGASIGWGAMVMFLTPIICVLLLITLIGIPLSFMLLAVWIIALFVSKILVGILIGRSITDKLWTKKNRSLIWSMIIGIAVAWIIFSLPIIGWLAALVAAWWGLGGIWLYFRKA